MAGKKEVLNLVINGLPSIYLFKLILWKIKLKF